MRGINDRFATIVKLIDDDRIYLPYTVVHAAERVDYSFAGRTPHSARVEYCSRPSGSSPHRLVKPFASRLSQAAG
jgi:hypothetical protein